MLSSVLYIINPGVDEVMLLTKSLKKFVSVSCAENVPLSSIIETKKHLFIKVGWFVRFVFNIKHLSSNHTSI